MPNDFIIITYMISHPTPCCGHPSSNVTSREVLRTELFKHTLSRGRMVLKLIISALIPSFAKTSAACNITYYFF
jgi:hypothetical protein